MTDATEHEAPDTGLDDYVDPPMPLDLSGMIMQAQIAAAQPKPTLREMIDAVTLARWSIEDHQSRNLAAGFFEKPQPGPMRQAGILAATANFLELIHANQDAVKRALKGKT